MTKILFFAPLFFSSLCFASSSYGPATHLEVVRQPSALSDPNKAFAIQPSFRIADDEGRTVTNLACVVSVSLQGANDGDVLLGNTSVAAVNGIIDFSNASLRVLTNSGGPNYYLQAVGNDNCENLAPAESDPFTVTTNGIPAEIKVISTPISVEANQIWDRQPVVEILDAYGHLVRFDSSTLIQVSIAESAESVTLQGTTALLAVNGIVTFSDLAIGNVYFGRYILHFTASDPAFPLFHAETTAALYVGSN